MPTNEAAWMMAKRAGLTVGPAPYTAPRADEIVVRTRAVAINPVDWLLPIIGEFAFPWFKYPLVPGSDVAGEVVEIGSAVTRFRVGDRVLGHAVGADKARNTPAEGAFQRYVVLLEHMAAPMPEGMTFEQAAVLPLGLSTAACGLFQSDQLALAHPRVDAAPSGKTLLVWGGSTSVGSNAIQLAVAAGYEVITTASPRNFDYVRGLGASQAFDYHSETVVADIIAACRGKTMAGALAIGIGSTDPCIAIVHGCVGNKFVSVTSPPISFGAAPAGARRVLWLVPTIARMVAASVASAVRARLWGVRTNFVFGTSLMHNEVGGMIYRAFLPAALAEGRFVAAPEAMVVGEGLGAIAAALAVQKKGVSARKVVVLI